MAETLYAIGVGAAAAKAVGAAAGVAGTAASLASAGLSTASSLRRASLYDRQAQIADFNARQELLLGQEESNKIREDLLRRLGALNAAYGAAGIDVGSGTPLTVEQEAIDQADRELDTSRLAAMIRASGRAASAAELRSRASSSTLSAGRSLLDYVSPRARLVR